MAQQPPAPLDPHVVASLHGHHHAADQHHADHHHADHHHGDHHDLTKDRAPAFTGLVASAVLLFALMIGMVKWTNGRFAGHSKAAGASAAAHK